MANDAFTISIKNFLGANTYAHIDPLDSTMKGMFVDHAFDIPLVDSDGDISAILSTARLPTTIASCPALTTKAITGTSKAVFGADNLVFPLLSGPSVESLLIFKDTAVEATSALWLFWDTATGLPLTPNGADVTVQWATVSGDTGGLCVYG